MDNRFADKVKTTAQRNAERAAAHLLSDDRDKEANVGNDVFQGAADSAAPSGSHRKAQKKSNKKRYAARARKRMRDSSRAAGKAGKNGAGIVSNAAALLKDAGKGHAGGIIMVLACFLFVMVIVSGVSSCSLFLQGGDTVSLTSYAATDEDILYVEEQYRSLEEDYIRQVETLRHDFEDYDAFDIQLDEIGHDPYKLAAFLTATHGAYSWDDGTFVLVRYMVEQQYDLAIEFIDGEQEDEDGVPWPYSTLKVRLTNRGIDAAIEAYGMSEDERAHYALLLETKGNRPDLFSSLPYGTASTQPYADYRIRAEYLTDTRFSNMMQEATKYLGRAYVWGGSTPETGFDCSGFVSWVVDHCGNGWNVGRLTANGLLGVCTVIPESEARPGDLVFFQGTYDTEGASHVAIYVGDHMIIHCGNPVSYANLQDAYYREHLLAFGRLN